MSSDILKAASRESIRSSTDAISHSYSGRGSQRELRGSLALRSSIDPEAYHDLAEISEDLNILTASADGTNFHKLLSEKQKPSTKLRLYIVVFLVLHFFSLLFYVVHFQSWSIHDAFYFSVVSIWTVGYGDKVLDLKSDADVFFGIVWLLVGVALFGYVVGEFAGEFLLTQEKQADDGCAMRLVEWIHGKLHAKSEGLAKNLTTEMIMNFVFGCLEMALALLIGTVGFAVIEGQPWQQSMWWAVVTATTVGFGDIVPTTAKGKIFVSCFIPVGVALTLSSVASFAQIPLTGFRQRLKSHLRGANLNFDDLQHLMCGDDIKRLDLSQHDGCVTRNEFTLYMLHCMDHITEEDLRMCQTKFAELDRTRSGTLSIQDLKCMKLGAKKVIKHAKTGF